MFNLREAAVDSSICITHYLQTDPKELYKLTVTISTRTTEFGTDIQGEVFTSCFAEYKCSITVWQRIHQIPVSDKKRLLGQKILKQDNQRLMKFRTVTGARCLNWCESS